jgi:iron complex outermembrane receptor protein
LRPRFFASGLVSPNAPRNRACATKERCVMGIWVKRLQIIAAALAMAGVAHQALADDERTRTIFSLPTIEVADAPSIGIAGASTTVITAQELERAPEQSLVDIISREAGVQSTNLQGGVNNAGNTGTVDLRGFGVTAPSNTLVLVDGRRFNDSDLTGFDFSLIPRNSIERIEIVRGNSGAVLYGDGAVGGVINIVTKNGIGQKPNARIEGGLGSLETAEAKASATGSFGPFSAAAFANLYRTDGYRANGKTEQQQAIGDLRYSFAGGSAFFNMGGSHVDQRLPGPRNVTNLTNEYVNDRRGTNTPLDNAQWDNMFVRGGMTRNVGTGIDFTLDGSFRQKQTTFAQFNARGGFLPPDAPSSFNTTTVNAYSITPRVNVDQVWGNVRARMIAGVDVYRTDYESFRRLFEGAAPQHVYDFNQTTTAAYAQPTLTLWNNTDVSFGGRVQHNSYQFRDAFDPLAPVGPLGTNPQGIPLDTDETRHAFHLGFEHRFAPVFAVFGRFAQSFRVPNIDERVGASPVLVVTNFNLRTQRSHDVEAGAKFNFGPFVLTSSVYQMNLVDELHFSPITFANTNLDPTRRIGWENTAYWRATDTVSIKSTLTYIDATFRSGAFAGKEVPEVANWSGSTTFSWDIYGKYLTADLTTRYFSDRWLDGDEANVGRMKVPAYAMVDVRVGGAFDRYFWSITAQNLFDRKIFDYGLDQSFGAFTFINLYPLPGRTVMLRVGANL